MSRKNYINPSVVAVTAEQLEKYKKNHPNAKTPMADMCANEPASERPRYVRAAQRLHWNVTRTQGKVYENGVLVWEL